VEVGVTDRDVVTLVRPAIGLAPEPMQDGELILHAIGPLADRREVESQPPMLDLVPACPTPTSIRPPLISSTVVTTLAKAPGCRKVTGDTSTPRPSRSVSRARPATTDQASVVGWPAGPGKLW